MMRDCSRAVSRGRGGVVAARGSRALVVLVASLAAGALALLALPTVARPETPRYQMKAEQSVRIAPATSAAKMGVVFSGEYVEVHCQDRGGEVQGSTLWNFIQYQVDGTDGLVKRGWVPDYYVRTGTTGPLDGVKQGGCPGPLTEPGAPTSPPPAQPEDGLPAGCVAKPATESLDLKAGIRRRRAARSRAAVTVRYGEPIKVRGELITPDGAPVAGAPICVVTRQSRSGASPHASGFVTTGADGSFVYEPRRRGASRRISFVHATGAGAVSDSVRVRVRAATSFRGSRRSLRNGDTLIMSGHLRGGPHRRGVLIELQNRRSGGWQTFGTTRANRKGRFRFPYTFTRTLGVQRYMLRARVPAQKAYPYATGASRPLKVTVSG